MRKAALHAIFLDLHNSYDSLDSSRCLGILEGYGVVPRSFRLLQQYRTRLKRVAQAGGYYRAPFYGEIGVNQFDPLSPTIFNMLVDAVVCHWQFLLVTDRKGV